MMAREAKIVKCKRCGKRGLHWEKLGGVWRLYDEGYSLHECEVRAGHTYG